MSLFIGIYRALYDYEAQNEEELALSENDLLYLLETSEVDDWWKVKKRVIGAEAEEPAGLVPSNYIEQAPVISSAVLLFDYDKQTDEELSFKEGASFDVYDTSDTDWILVGLNKTQFGFVPANYIEVGGSAAPALSYGSTLVASSYLPPPQRISPQTTAPPPPPPPPQEEEEEQAPLVPSKEDNYHSRYTGFEPQPSNIAAPILTQQQDEDDDEDAPPMPSRPRPSTNYDDEEEEDLGNTDEFVKDDFFTWPVQEIDNKGKKTKNTLGVGNATVYLSPELSSGATPKQWKVQNLLNFSNEKKHVFLEFEKPYTNIELHAGSKDAAEAIVSIMGDIKGAVSMKGLQEVKAASVPSKANGRQTGRIIFDFEAATEDELTVKENDIVYIINDKKSKDWWMVENMDTGEQGVIPSNYVELTKSMRRSSSSNLLSKVSNRVANPNKKKRREKEKEKLRAEHAKRERELEDQQRERRRSRRERELRDREERERVRKYDERERLKLEKKSSSSSKEDKSKPNPHRVRTWIDRSGSFKVEAEFLGCVEGKIHLHKTNGVKIAVAAPKLSSEDIEYVERITGMSLENYKPKLKKEDQPPTQPVRPQQTGVVLQQQQEQKPMVTGQAKDPDYDWFEFFLNCGVDVNNCQRYQLNFNREQMDENILEDISPSLLRTLGLREGDILRVMKYLDSKFDRKKDEITAAPTGGIFQSSNGNLSTDRLATSDKVDGSKLSPVKTAAQNSTHQFEDDAWAVKPAAQTGAQEVPSRPSSVPTQQLNGSISDLINLKPMDPAKTGEIRPAAAAAKPTAPVLQPIRTGGTLAMEGQSYTTLNPQRTSGTMMGAQITGGLMTAQPTGFVPIGSFMPSQITGGFITANPTGLIPLQQTGFMPLQRTGGGLNTVQPTGLPLQNTGFIPLQNGITGSMPPQTSFGQMPLQKTGGFVPQTSFGQMLVQKTGGGGMPPVTSFNSSQQPTGSFPQTSFGQPQVTGFGMLPQKTGDFIPLQPTSNNNSMPAFNTGFGNNQFTGGLPQTSFGQQQFQPQQTSFGQPQQTGMFNPQQQQMNNLSNMFQNTSITSPPGQSQPFTSFGQQQQQQFNGFQDQPLQSQPTGFGFGNSGLQLQQTGFGFGNGATGNLQPQKTGRANLANATADNPFGF